MTLADHDIDLIELPPFVADPSALRSEPLSRRLGAGNLAEVDSGALLSFDATVPDQGLADVSNSLLFAQLAADKQAQGRVNARAWLTAFQGVLSAVGWGQIGVAIDNQTAKPPVDWKRLVLAQMPDRSVALASASIAAAAAMPASSEAMRIWNDATTMPTAALFSVGVCRALAGDPSLDLVTVGCGVNSAASAFLAWSPDYSITCCRSRWELNEDVYAQVRQSIINKLGDRIHQLIAPIPLD